MRFTCDDSRVMSVGGNDRCVIQWKTHGVKEDSKKFQTHMFQDHVAQASCHVAKAKAFFRRTFVSASSSSILKLCQPLTALFSCANQEEVDPKMYAMLNRVEQVVSANKIMIEDADRKIEGLLRMQAMKAHGPMKHDVRDAVALATSNRVDMDLDMKKVRLQVATCHHLQLPDIVTGSCCRSHRVTPAAAKSCSTSLHEPAAEALCVAGEGPVGQAFEGEEARAAREGVPAGRCC